MIVGWASRARVRPAVDRIGERTKSVSQPSAIASTSTTAVYGASFGSTNVASMAMAMPSAGKMPKLHRSWSW